MHHLVTPWYLPFLKLYSKQEPDFLLPFFESSALQRLAFVGQTCGTEYCKYYKYRLVHSRLDHSLGVASIIWHFTQDPKQTLAGLFHDISHTVFSHAGDFFLGDAKNHESSEQYTQELIEQDEIIRKELKNLNIPLEEVNDYTRYPIADNPGPQLSADRLEYTLTNLYALRGVNLEEIKKIYDDLTILKNEKQEPEIWFQNFEQAKLLGEYSIKNCEGCYSSYESVSAMAFLGELFKKAITKKLVTHKDLYYLTEPEFIKLLEKDPELTAMRNFYKNLESYKISRYYPKTNKYFVSSLSKRRYIDPLIATREGNQRLSTLSPEFCEKRDYHLKRKEERIILDYIL